MEIYLSVILIMSIIAFILYHKDKRKAIKNEFRIKEKVLLLTSFFFGSLGATLGMYIFHHKTKHWYFVVINFLSLIIHIILGVIIYKEVGFLFI